MNEPIVDQRSDTVTRSTEAMPRSVATARLGDDVIGCDPTVERLQELAADMLGKEAALFVASGTMGNRVCLLTHCRSGDDVVLGEPRQPGRTPGMPAEPRAFFSGLFCPLAALGLLLLASGKAEAQALGLIGQDPLPGAEEARDLVRRSYEAEVIELRSGDEGLEPRQGPEPGRVLREVELARVAGQDALAEELELQIRKAQIRWVALGGGLAAVGLGLLVGAAMVEEPEVHEPPRCRYSPCAVAWDSDLQYQRARQSLDEQSDKHRVRLGLGFSGGVLGLAGAVVLALATQATGGPQLSPDRKRELADLHNRALARKLGLPHPPASEAGSHARERHPADREPPGGQLPGPGLGPPDPPQSPAGPGSPRPPAPEPAPSSGPGWIFLPAPGVGGMGWVLRF